MKKDVVVKVENLSKKYQIGKKQSYLTLRDQLVTLPQRIFRKQKTEEFWALKNVSFEVKRGEVLGVIGRNGAGKTTLLKILSRITEPTKGKVTMKGKVASMLEVGTGFNPELTGRENIYLNGVILGMSRQEIQSKFDKIVEFSGISRFLDTPVKRYSSGMYVRLAFAVAAHLDTDILLVDEVLAVGDAEFQKKCLSKMSDLSKFGKTVIFVSHNIDSVNSLCHKGIMLDKGKIAYCGSIETVIKEYYNANSDLDITSNPIGNEIIFKESKNKPMCFVSLSIVDSQGKLHSGVIGEDDEIHFIIKYAVRKILSFPTHIALALVNATGTNILYTRDIGKSHKARKMRNEKGIFESKVVIPAHILSANQYFASITIFKTGGTSQKIDNHERVIFFNIVDKLNHIETSRGILSLDLKWKTIKVE